ncbi:MAG TPA: hypothetical protein VM238_02860 [Phycisphaerae bacterium]|nr:hypothetical protein [Phycisphaerae bacterium]
MEPHKACQAAVEEQVYPWLDEARFRPCVRCALALFARATQIPWKEGLTNTLDRGGVSGYKFPAAQAVLVTVVGTVGS